MFRDSYVKVADPFIKTDKKTNLTVGVSPIDQFPAQDFNLGVNGLPANDITLLSRATNQREYETILARLEEIHIQNPDNSGKSDEEIVGEIMPHWVSNPYLLKAFVDHYNQTHPVPFKMAAHVDEDNPGDPGDSGASSDAKSE